MGLVALDTETSKVLRLTLEANDMPKDFPVLGSSATVEYAFTDVAGREYLLPARRIGDVAVPRNH